MDNVNSSEATKDSANARYISEKLNQVGKYVVIGTCGALVAPPLTLGIVHAIGFSAGGVVAGSIAAGMQSAAVQSGSIFALTQSAGATGVFSATTAYLLSAVGGGVGLSLSSKL